MGSKYLDLTGNIFNRLTVIKRAENTKRVSWICKCSCGNETIVQTCDLKSKHTQSCGCLGKEKRQQASITHGKRNTPEYTSWYSMKTRCYNKNHKNFKYYGSRGIIVCDRWLNSFENFLADMGKKPSPKHSIDRIDVNGNYEPSNCRWATQQQQCSNIRKTSRNTTGIKGVSYHKANKKYVANIRTNGKQIYLGLFNTPEEAGLAYNKYIDEHNLNHRKAEFEL